MPYFISYARDNEYDDRSWICNAVSDEHPIDWIRSANAEAANVRERMGRLHAVKFVLINFWEISASNKDLFGPFSTTVEIKKG